MVSINEVSFSYEKHMPVLENVSFHIEEGESVAIVGANGAGKSTLLKLMVGLYMNYSGMIEICGYKLERSTLSYIRQKVGYVFQDADNQLFMPTVYEELAFGPRNYGYSKNDVEQLINHAMELTGCEHLKNKQIFRLSGGEKKLVSIATILSLEPEIIVMDEPSIALDPCNRRNLINILDSFDCTRIIASHDLDMIWEICERTILISEGHIAADGNTRDILSNRELLEANGLELPLSAVVYAYNNQT